ncbi:hypothetical protein Hanom_Chr06g00493091 [Helianthus anomalus]
MDVRRRRGWMVVEVSETIRLVIGSYVLQSSGSGRFSGMGRGKPTLTKLTRLLYTSCDKLPPKMFLNLEMKIELRSDEEMKMGSLQLERETSDSEVLEVNGIR